jgi:hypothetical protein
MASLLVGSYASGMNVIILDDKLQFKQQRNCEWTVKLQMLALFRMRNKPVARKWRSQRGGVGAQASGCPFRWLY